MRKLPFFLLLALFGNLTSFGAETDNFTGRAHELASLSDSTDILDEFVNKKLEESVQRANEVGGCPRRQLYLNVWNALGRNPVGETESFAENEPKIEKFLIDFRNGIYGDVPTFLDERRWPTIADLFILTGWFSASIRLNHQIIGIDKLGHFFGQGWEYFQSGSLRKALRLGEEDERGLDGFIGSGVFSYADLATNVSGLQFWQKLLDGSRPYIRCEAGKFIKMRKFTWKDYVTPSWDEGLNCSKYVSPQMTHAVEAKIRSQGQSCPIDPNSCKAMVNTPCADHFVNPDCFKIVGVDLKKKGAECEKFLSNLKWNFLESGVLTYRDQLLIQLDTWMGISTLSLHFIARDLKLKLQRASSRKSL